MNILNVIRYAPEFGGGFVKHLTALGVEAKQKGHKLILAYGNKRQWRDKLKLVSDIIIIPEMENPLRSGFPKKLLEICENLRMMLFIFIFPLHYHFLLPYFSENGEFQLSIIGIIHLKHYFHI